jgi:hypothetical protein
LLGSQTGLYATQPRLPTRSSLQQGAAGKTKVSMFEMNKLLAQHLS